MISAIDYKKDLHLLHFEMKMEDLPYFIAMRAIALNNIDIFTFAPIIEKNNTFLRDEAIELFMGALHVKQSPLLSSYKFEMNVSAGETTRVIYIDQSLKILDNSGKVVPYKWNHFDNLYFTTLFPGGVIKLSGKFVLGNIKNDGYLHQAVGNFGMKQSDKIYVTIQLIETYDAEIITIIAAKWLQIIAEFKANIMAGKYIFASNGNVTEYILMPIVNELCAAKHICMCNNNKTKKFIEFIYDGEQGELIKAIDNYSARVAKLIK